ncbi:hypothetical protein [Nonomuraea rhizosphaerae]|uniref:hypothetical protein n=1 Tax=Nonomuraea rhizosphaerae TaxID=2665663 RepID=UPI001C5D4833|nr:hypothetical protein [Nonomuraea rhizosphaerae]
MDVRSDHPDHNERMAFSEVPEDGLLPTEEPAIQALAQVVSGAVTTWPSTWRLCLICMAISVPAITVLLLFLLMR